MNSYELISKMLKYRIQNLKEPPEIFSDEETE